MLDSVSENIGHNHHEKYQPKLLSSEEVLNNAKLDLTDKNNLTNNQIEEFAKKHVKIVKIGNANVTIIDQEHEGYSGNLDPVLQTYLNSPRTKTAVVEYFMPELRRNAPQKLPEFVSQLCGNVDELEKEGIGSMFMDIAEIMKKREKTITCVDIANKPTYEAYYHLIKAQLVPTLSLFFRDIPISPLDRLLFSWILPTASFGIDSVLEATGKGIYDKQKISKLENLYLSMEDARRIYAAKALEQLASDYNKEYPSQDKQNNPQILVIYPKAHAIRIADYMINPSKFSQAAKTAKEFLYHLPHLDYSYRTYSWKDTLARISNKPELASWQLTTSKKFSLFK